MGRNGHNSNKSKDEVMLEGHSKNSVINSLATGSISSIATTIVYQPLELLKTRIQLRDGVKLDAQRVLGRATRSALHLIRQQGLTSLWKGTGVVSIL